MGIICASFNFDGVMPRSRQSLQSLVSGLTKDDLHFFSRSAENPSGPEAAVLRSSSIASDRSSSVNAISISVGMLGSSFCWKYGLSQDSLKADEYY